MNKHSFPFYLQPNGSAHNEYASFYPVYDNNFAENAQIKVMPLENFTSQCGYAAMVYPQTNYNGVEQSHVDANSCNYVGCRFTTTDSSLAPNDKNLVENDSDNETRNTVLPDEINHLDAQLNETYNLRNADKNCNNNKNCIITAMNIVDKKNGTLDSSDNTTISNNIKMPEKTFGLRINIPNYTYIDTSDSSTCSNSNDSSDFSDSTSDNEDLSDSCQKKKCNRNNGTISNNTSSDSDSDSYVAYSTNLNPYEKLKRELPRIASTDKSSSNATTLECSTYNSEHLRNVSESSVQSEKVYSKENYFHYSDNRNPCLTFEQDITGVATKRYSDDEDRTDDQSDFNSCPNENQDTANSNCELNIKYRDQECPVIDDTVSYQLGIIHNDTERPDSESISCENKRNIDERNETFSKASDDSSDDAETTMVSVSLPLKFKFFVSEDNEDITTVIIGNSKINAEKSCSAKDSVKDNKAENVSVNFHIGNDTSVDFTMKRDISDATCATTSTNEKAVNIESVIPQVDFTLKKDRMRISETSCEKQNSMELTVTKTEHDEINCTEPASRDVDHTASQSVTVTQDVLLNSEIRDNVQAEFICNNFENIYSDKTIADNEPKVATFEYCETQNDFISEPQVQIQLVDTDKMEQENYTIVNNNDDTELCCQAKLSVQDSRENTDDEDSGVTSDISRIISEVDTDSECTSSKHLKKYQRTQTHSRLFRLLNDDSVPSKTDSSFRKKYLSLPLNTDAFNCDDSCCSNHSSGLTSPEYSPIHEQSLGKFYSTINGNIIGLSNIKMDPSANQSEQIPSKEDPYFRFWKNPNLPDAHKHDVVPSLAFKILDSKMPSWAYKANVLCPRIKSTKNVPQTLSTIRKMNKIKNPSPSPPANLPIPTSYANSY
ncbi:dentin sialophosphoprotein-like [Linepithema humile]|uniref:dentin sialophosphoprotein-like n=1 Tax=Linepithema humile TaxID=83485 RepID=UPI00351E4308